MSLLEQIRGRRSVPKLTSPAPTREQLEQILQVATTVPDHGCLRPYRFVCIDEQKRTTFADAFEDSVRSAKGPEVPDALIEKARKKAEAAPLQVVIVFSPVESKIPEWEQRITAGCTGYAMGLAAHALGIGAIWKSIGVPPANKMTNLLSLKPGEEMLGWINLGSPLASPPARPAPDLAEFVTF